MAGRDRMSVGLIGVGAIGSRLVEAIMTGPRADSVDFTLSPRSTLRSTRLAQRYPNVAVGENNQEVVDRSELVLIGVLPDQVGEVCSALRFREDHVVVGLAAGWPPSSLRPTVSPAAHVCQVIPLPMVAMHTGPIVASPAVPEVRWLLTGCGDVIDAPKEDDALALLCATATMSSFIEPQLTIIEWLVGRGLSPSTAKAYIDSFLQGLAVEFAAEPVAELQHLTRQHETPGGLNERVRQMFLSRGLFRDLRNELDEIHRAGAATGTRLGETHGARSEADPPLPADSPAT